MNKLLFSLKSCMSDLNRKEDATLTADFIFPKGFLGFNGHFPDKPIVPGVCKIQAAMLMLQEDKKAQLALREISLAKFFSPVTCNEKVTFFIKEEPGINDELLVKVSVSDDKKKIAELHLRVALA